MITATAAMTTALADPESKKTWGFRLDRKTATDYIWLGYGSKSALGQTWTGVGEVVSVGGFEQSEDIVPMQIGFSVIDPVRLGQAIAQDEFVERPCGIYLMAVDPATALIVADPIHLAERIMFPGPMNGSSSTWVVNLEPKLVSAYRGGRRVRSHQDQKRWAAALGEANDEALIDVHALPFRDVAWPGPTWQQKRGT